MRFLFVVLLVAVCVDCRRNGRSKGNGRGKGKNNQDAAVLEPVVEEVVVEEAQALPESCEVNMVVIPEYGTTVTIDLRPGGVIQDRLDQCRLYQCVASADGGAVLEEINIPADYGLHEVLIHDPEEAAVNIKWARGKRCKLVMCMNLTQNYLMVKNTNFGDNCSSPVNDA